MHGKWSYFEASGQSNWVAKAQAFCFSQSTLPSFGYGHTIASLSMTQRLHWLEPGMVHKVNVDSWALEIGFLYWTK